MPKIKTRKGIAKRIRVTGNGKLMRASAWKSHLREHKSTNRKRNYETAQQVTKPDRTTVRRAQGAQGLGPDERQGRRQSAEHQSEADHHADVSAEWRRVFFLDRLLGVRLASGHGLVPRKARDPVMLDQKEMTDDEQGEHSGQDADGWDG